MQRKMPAQLPRVLEWRRDNASLFEPAKLFASEPKYFQDDRIEATYTLYHHLLQKAIINWMSFNYRTGWQMEINRFDLPSASQITSAPTLKGLPGRRYTTEEIQRLLKGNYFAGTAAGFPPEFVLPPDMKLSIEPPEEKAGLDTGTIRMESLYCTILLKTTFLSYMMGIGGYKKLAGLSDDENLGTINYMIRLSINYNPFFSGSPDTTRIKRWADQLADGLKNQFDEQRLWSEAKDDYLFLQQVEFFGPVKVKIWVTA
jgi:hypothetical protein